jgi:hypothetical protein
MAGASTSRLETGAMAATPRRRSGPSYAGAIWPANSAPWPPCECPSRAYRTLSAGSRKRAALTLSIMDRASLNPTRYGCAAGVPRPG